MKIALINTTAQEVLRVWTTETGEVATRYALPEGAQISPVTLGWADDHHAVVAVTQFTVPEGKVTVGAPSYAVDGGAVTETYTVEDYRPMVRKSTVQQRLIDAEKIDAAYAALTQQPAAFARWFAPDQPSVYCDDPDAVALVMAIEADPETILAPEDE